MLKFVPHMGNPIVFVAQNATAPTAVHSSLLRGGRLGIVPPAGRRRVGVKTTGSDHDPANEAQNHDGERKCSEVRIRAERQAHTAD